MKPHIILLILGATACRAESNGEFPPFPKIDNGIFLRFIGLDNEASPLTLIPLTDGSNDISSDFLRWVEMMRDVISKKQENEIDEYLTSVLDSDKAVKIAALGQVFAGTAYRHKFTGIP